MVGSPKRQLLPLLARELCQRTPTRSRYRRSQPGDTGSRPPSPRWRTSRIRRRRCALSEVIALGQSTAQSTHEVVQEPRTRRDAAGKTPPVVLSAATIDLAGRSFLAKVITNVSVHLVINDAFDDRSPKPSTPSPTFFGISNSQRHAPPAPVESSTQHRSRWCRSFRACLACWIL